MADEVFSIETFKNLAQKAEILSLKRLGGVWKNLIPEIICVDDEGATNLVEITLSDISTLKCLIDNSDSGVQNVLSMLELLKNVELVRLCDCIHLEGTLFKSKISLSNLTHLFIERCQMLTSLFELSTTQSLVLLKKLWIFNCNKLKSIVRDENERKDSGDEIVDVHNHNKGIISMFPNLTTLDISFCRQLDFIFPMPAARHVPKLATIEIKHCNELKYIFGPYQHKHEEEELLQGLKDVIFTTLKKVILQDLPNFVDIFPKCDESMYSSDKRSSPIYESKTQVEPKPLHWIHKYRKKWRTTKIPLNSKEKLQDSSLSMVRFSPLLILHVFYFVYACKGLQ